MIHCTGNYLAAWITRDVKCNFMSGGKEGIGLNKYCYIIIKNETGKQSKASQKNLRFQQFFTAPQTKTLDTLVINNFPGHNHLQNKLS